MLSLLNQNKTNINKINALLLNLLLKIRIVSKLFLSFLILNKKNMPEFLVFILLIVAV